MFRRSFVVASTLAVLAGAVHAQDLDALKADTRKNALPVLPKVVAMMQETVAEKGAIEAIPVCKEKAPLLLKEQSAKTGWDMRRVSLRTRNPERGTPDVWEARQLADFNIRAANGEKIETLEAGEIVTENGKQIYRYIRAVPVGDVCLKCHGAPDKIEASLKSQLAKSYPHDTAFGYEKGQIRGGLTVKRPL
ncbi:DUF3365 domain-containing protein [Zoogloea oryzae]|uniref:Tll0287-like domain-containing protein n=1 Tax=Zoogloea oryzae TaxID=310767 RepID=A0ABQ6F5V7_9RHOO|nr:DUF3365 domain-containing protein [Zoogloea oryzae]GLT20634.1 hypothetical protein GCM10007933_00850 [Zoogloea oryzae]